MILYEIIIGRPACSRAMTVSQMACAMVTKDWRPTIPDDVIPANANLIQYCLAIDYREPGISTFINSIEAGEFF
jgi:hypothetical protein